MNVQNKLQHSEYKFIFELSKKSIYDVARKYYNMGHEK